MFCIYLKIGSINSLEELDDHRHCAHINAFLHRRILLRGQEATKAPDTLELHSNVWGV